MTFRPWGAPLAAALVLCACGPVETDQQVHDDRSTPYADLTAFADLGEPPAGATGSARFLTYNVHGLPSIITGDDTAGRYQLIAPLLGDFDIIGLQEDFMDENHAVFASAAPHQTLRRFADVLPDKVYGSGLTVLASVGEVDFQHTHYTDCNGVFDSGSDCLASKGFQVVRLELAPGVEVDVYNTHLDAGGGADDDAARATQVDQLLDSMTGYSADRAIVFTGDTNLDIDDPNEAPTLQHLLTTAGLTDSCEAVACPEVDHIDRILYRSSDLVQVEALDWINEPAFFDGSGNPMSDHPALSAELRWVER